MSSLFDRLRFNFKGFSWLRRTFMSVGKASLGPGTGFSFRNISERCPFQRSNTIKHAFIMQSWWREVCFWQFDMDQKTIIQAAETNDRFDNQSDSSNSIQNGSGAGRALIVIENQEVKKIFTRVGSKWVPLSERESWSGSKPEAGVLSG